MKTTGVSRPDESILDSEWRRCPRWPATQSPTEMDDKAEILKLLAKGPENVGGLARRLGIGSNALFSLLMKMEKEDLIVWNGRAWDVTPSSESKRHRAHPSTPGDVRADGQP